MEKDLEPNNEISINNKLNTGKIKDDKSETFSPPLKIRRVVIRFRKTISFCRFLDLSISLMR